MVQLDEKSHFVMQCDHTKWCRGYHYCTTSFIKAWTQVLRRLKSRSKHVRDLEWWRSLTMFQAGNKAQRLLSVSNTINTIQFFVADVSWKISINVQKSFFCGILISGRKKKWRNEEILNGKKRLLLTHCTKNEVFH